MNFVIKFKIFININKEEYNNKKSFTEQNRI